MRYQASEKLEIIRLVERSSRPNKWALDKLGGRAGHSIIGTTSIGITVRTGLSIVRFIPAAYGTRYRIISTPTLWIWHSIYRKFCP